MTDWELTTACRTERHSICGDYRCPCNCHFEPDADPRPAGAPHCARTQTAPSSTAEILPGGDDMTDEQMERLYEAWADSEDHAIEINYYGHERAAFYAGLAKAAPGCDETCPDTSAHRALLGQPTSASSR